jgi:SAM-dependent methyltransferase
LVNVAEEFMIKTGDYKNLINELLAEVSRFPDKECFSSSAEAERSYILGKYQRIRLTIEYFSYILKDKKYKNRKCRILDIGTSPFTFIYNKVFNTRISTIDLTDQYKRRCGLNNIRFKKCNLLTEDIPFPEGEFDIVIFTEVFEHLIGPPQLIFGRIRKVLARGGVLVFSTPNISSYYNLVMLLAGKSILTPVNLLFKEESPGKWIAHGYGHWRKFTMKELIDLLSEYQFKVIKYKRIIKPYMDIKTTNPFKLIKRLGWNALASILPAVQFNLILARKE